MRSLLVLLVLGLTESCNAQDAREVTLRFLRFGGDDDSATVLATSNKGVEITCPLSTSSISAEIVCSPKDNRIAFLSPDERQPAGTAIIPTTIKKALLVFVKTAQASAPNALSWRILVIEDTPKTFPNGGAFISNFHNKEIRFILGEHKGMLHPGGTHGYARPVERDAFNMAPVIFQFLQEDQWRTADESTLRFLPGVRYLIFAYVDPLSGRPRVSTVRDLAQSAPQRVIR